MDALDAFGIMAAFVCALCGMVCLSEGDARRGALCFTLAALNIGMLLL
jgi:hypothetical protein